MSCPPQSPPRLSQLFPAELGVSSVGILWHLVHSIVKESTCLPSESACVHQETVNLSKTRTTPYTSQHSQCHTVLNKCLMMKLMKKEWAPSTPSLEISSRVFLYPFFFPSFSFPHHAISWCSADRWHQEHNSFISTSEISLPLCTSSIESPTATATHHCSQAASACKDVDSGLLFSNDVDTHEDEPFWITTHLLQEAFLH